MFRHILYYVTSVFLLLHPYVCYSTDYKPDKETEKRIEALLGKMTLEEKIGQMNQLHCENFPYLKTETRKGRVGSVMSITDPNIFNEVQRIARRRLPPRYSAYQRQRRDTRIQNHLPYTFGASRQFQSGDCGNRCPDCRDRSFRRRNKMDIRPHDRYHS